MKYLVYQKGFIAKHNMQERGKNLGNTREVVVYFEERTNIEVIRQERLEVAEEQDFRQAKLPGRYIA